MHDRRVARADKILCFENDELGFEVRDDVNRLSSIAEDETDINVFITDASQSYTDVVAALYRR